MAGHAQESTPAQTALPQVELALTDAIQKALANNLSIHIERYALAMSAENIKKTEAAFGRNLSSSSGYTLNESENQNAPQNTVSADVSLDQKLKTGQSYQVRLQTKITDYAASQMATSHIQTLSLALTQPVLKNRGTEVNTAKIVIAANNQLASASSLRSKVIETVVQVINRYWELIQAREVLEADQYALQLAYDQIKNNEAKVKVGMLAPIEVLQAQSSAASREVQIIGDRQQVQNTVNELKQLLNIREDDPLWPVDIIPTTALDTALHEFSLDECVRLALDHREEVQRQRIALENQRISLETARHQLRPELNLQVTVGLSGSDEQWGGAWGNFFELETYNAGLSLNFSYPLGNQSAKSDYQNAVLAYDQAVLSQQNLEQQITMQIRQALLTMTSAYQQIQATELARQLAEQQLQAEQRKFQEGLSTNFQVLTYQQQTASAQSNYTKAVVSYNKALVSLEQLMGLTLQQHNIVVEE